VLRVLIAALAAGAVAAPAALASNRISLPDCAWEARSDPVAVNALYPDEDAIYYIAALPVPRPGIGYRITGRFPHARYMSFVSYNGLPMDALADADIEPDADAVNPFVAGADRTATRRGYAITLSPETPPAQRAKNTLYVGGGQLGTPAPVYYVFYRIYVPDQGTGPRGGVPLPTIEEVGGQTTITQDLQAFSCNDLREQADASPLPTVQDSYANASPLADDPAALRSDTSPPTWTVESGLTAAALGTAGQGDLVHGGPGSNPHNLYIAAPVSRALGEVIAIRGTAPTTPATFLGQPLMSAGDLRYWSFCQNSRTTRYVACLSDSHVALDGDPDESGHRHYTIAISDPADRPANARNWLPFGPEPEGQVLFRHMLPSAAFRPHSAQGYDPAGTSLATQMGEFYPRAVYCTKADFEKDQCGL